MKNFILFILAVFILSCSNLSQQTVSTQKAKGLSYEQAKLRSERISGVHYNLSFSLDKTKKDLFDDRAHRDDLYQPFEQDASK